MAKTNPTGRERHDWSRQCYKGRVYDRCCGSGGIFVSSEKFIEAHSGKIGNISIYGQESNYTTRHLAKGKEYSTMSTQIPEPPIPEQPIPEAPPTPKQNPNPKPKPEPGMPPPTFPKQ